jgi:hypothetical protein
MIRLGGFGKGRGSLIVRAGAYPAAKPFFVKKHPLWKVNIESVGRFAGVHTSLTQPLRPDSVKFY